MQALSLLSAGLPVPQVPLLCPVKVDRNKEPPRCRLCPYYQPDFRYRRCLFSACPYGKGRNTAFRRKPLRKEKIIGKEVGGMNA